MHVNCYTLTTETCDGGPAPRAWRIATEDGVFWLVTSGGAARLVRLPQPGSHSGDRPLPDGDPWAAVEALAYTAETVVADRWVRGGQPAPPDHRVGDVAADLP